MVTMSCLQNISVSQDVSPLWVCVRMSCCPLVSRDHKICRLPEPDVILHCGLTRDLGPDLVSTPEQAGQGAHRLLLGLKRRLPLGLGEGCLGLPQSCLSLSLKSLLLKKGGLSLLLDKS